VDRQGASLLDRGQEEPAPEAAPRRRWRPNRTIALVAAVVVAVIAANAFALTRGPDTPPISRADVDRAVQNGIADAEKKARQAPPDAAAAYRVVAPSMVVISTTGTSDQGAERGTGAGVVVSQDGTILTALHVVGDADSITVRFADGTQSVATVKEATEANDTASLTPRSLPKVVVPAVLGGGTQVGDDVFAVGHPLGLADSLSAGVVSALDRSIKVSASRTLAGLIQFDAAVNPGNSGGPLLNRDGQVVGIVTGLANPSEQNFFVGIGFAVPIASAGGSAGAPEQ
jgi:S1-C subfamily serine protease